MLVSVQHIKEAGFSVDVVNMFEKHSLSVAKLAAYIKEKEDKIKLRRLKAQNEDH